MSLRFAALVFVFAMLSASPAIAFQDVEGRVIENNAYTLQQGQIQIGLWRFAFGLTDNLDVGTYTWPWLLPLINADTKWRICCNEEWNIAIRGGVVYTDTDLLWAIPLEEGDDAKLWVIPVEIPVTWQFTPKWSISLTPSYTQVLADGQISGDTFEGASVTSNLQLIAQLEWRVSDVTSFILLGRSTVAQTADVALRATVEADAYTTVDVYGTGSGSDVNVENKGLLMLKTAFSWESFGLLLGLGAGNFNLPVVNFMVANKGVVFDFDMYWRF